MEEPSNTLIPPYDNPNLNYDSMDHEERQMVYEITGVKNSGVKIN